MNIYINEIRFVAVCIALALVNFGMVFAADESPSLTNQIQLLQMDADRGNAEAQYHFGLAYVNGDGVETNYTEAAKWFRKAAEQGNAGAQCRLGLAYSNSGNGVAKDVTEAVKWFRLSAAQGNDEAQYCLGVAYANGYGVNKDSQMAFGFLLLAADGGNAKARSMLALLEKTLSPSEQEAAQSWAKQHKPRIVGDQGNDRVPKDLQ